MFLDRKDAGSRLASAVKRALEQEGWYDLEKLVVFGIPRGGVVVAAEVAKHLQCPLDVVVARKIGSPINPELAIGAVAPDGSVVLDPVLSGWMGADRQEISNLAHEVYLEIQRRAQMYGRGQSGEAARGRTAILVDDGIATGITVRAALRFLKSSGAARTVVATPVAPRETVLELQREADLVVCVETPADFMSVGQWYLDFSQVSDEEVLALLNEGK